MSKFCVLALLLALVGCAAPPPPAVAPEIAEAAWRPLDCANAQQCAVWWRRTQVWIASNSRMKIQIATDAIIETYNAVDYAPVFAYRATREPRTDGGERIVLSMSCGNPLGCHENSVAIRARFNAYVREGNE